MEEVCKRIYRALAYYKDDAVNAQFQDLVNPMYFGNSPIGFFDEASNRENSGIGVMIKLASTHCFKAHMSIGVETNIRAELLALWTMLFLSKRLDLKDVYIVGDSKVVIDCFNDKVALNVLILQPWKEKVKNLGSSFSFIQVFHIHRVFNTVADILSKAGLSSSIGILHVEEFVDGEKISYWSLIIFSERWRHNFFWTFW